jgi:hypothetical protein
MVMPITGGTPVLLASSPDPRGIALDATAVCWTDDIAQEVLKVAKLP